MLASVEKSSYNKHDLFKKPRYMVSLAQNTSHIGFGRALCCGYEENIRTMLNRVKRLTQWAQDRWYLLFINLLLVMRVFFWFSPSHAEKINMIYLWPAVTASAVLMFYSRRALLPKGFALSTGAVLWLFLSCLINGDAYLIYNRTFILGVFISFISFLIVIPTLHAGQRAGGFAMLSLVYGVLMLLLAALSIGVVLTGTPFSTPLSDERIHVSINRLFLFRYHPNEVGSAFVIGLYLLMYLLLRSRAILYKLLLAAGVLILSLAIALTGSRTAILLAACGIGFAVFWLVCHHAFEGKSRAWVKWVIGTVSMLAVTLIVYVALTFSVGVISNLSSLTASQRAAEATITQTPADTAEAISQAPADTVETIAQTPNDTAADNAVHMDESRILLKDIGTFNMRVEIWQTGLTYLAENPRALLFGAPDHVVARIPSSVGRSEFHMHNAYLEMLLLGGIPGLLLYLGFLFVVFRSCLQLAFGKRSRLEHRFLAMLPVLIAVNGITEIYPLFSGNVMDMMFFAISGAVIVFAQELYPPASKRSLDPAL